jgi:hypothetical protein
VDRNISATLALLHAAVEAGVEAFVMTSSTTVFGDALVPAPNEPAAWVDETVVPVPKNIYGANQGRGRGPVPARAPQRGPELCCAADIAVLSRGRRSTPRPRRSQRREREGRRVRLPPGGARGCRDRRLLSAQRAPEIGFARYVISATTPFLKEDLAELRTDAAAVFARRAPRAAAVWAERGWRFPRRLDRMYVNARARRELGWRPEVDLDAVAATVAASGSVRSPLSQVVGSKEYAGSSYHLGRFAQQDRA